MVFQVKVTRGKPIAIIPLNQHFNKLIPNDLSLYPRINSSLTLYQGSRWWLTQRLTSQQGSAVYTQGSLWKRKMIDYKC